MTMDIQRSWTFLEKVLTFPLETAPDFIQWKVVQANQELREAVLFLGSPGMYQLLEEWLHETLLQYLRQRVSPAFWKFFQGISGECDNSGANTDAFITAFEFLYDVYSMYFTVSLKRLRWLHLLAASAPAAAPSPPLLSAFTPVRSCKPSISAVTGVISTDTEKEGLLPGATKADKLTRTDKTNRAETGRLSVTFEKGTKGDEEMETSLVDSSLEASISFVPSGSQGGRQICSGSKDSSYLQEPVIALEHSDLSDCVFSNSETFSTLISNPALSLEDGEELESFIRSPIGGNIKLMAAGRLKTSALPMGMSETFASDSQGSCGSSVSTLRGTSLTSTPGVAIKQTPGPITPIIAEDSPAVFSDISLEGSLTQQNISSLNENMSAVLTEKSADILPDIQEIFGINASSRPVPGGTVRWPNGAQNKVQVMIKAVLFYTFPSHFALVVKNVYARAFDMYKKGSTDSQDDDENTRKDQDRFDDVNRKMDEMNIMELVSGAAVTDIVHTQIEKHIEEECKGNFDTSYLSNLEEWLDQQVLGWLNHIYACKQTVSQLASVGAFRDRLRHFIYETYAKSLINQFFDIIIDYPDSKPAILDLSACLEKTDLRSELVSTLRHALESRLLHPGVNTADILTAYIAAIKSLRLLEPAGVILELVCEPVGRYLRSREDTVRCIVASLTDEGNNELISELVNTKPVADEHPEEDGNMCGWEEWVPDPVDADPSNVSKNRRSADILSTLVNIYGSKELFVNEYRALLADRILMQYNYDVERELRYLELLKLRFGEAQLHFCEVMLRDVTESRRVNAHIQEARKSAVENPGGVSMSAMILSAQFWPTFRDEKIKLPPELEVQMDRFTKDFEAQKQNRTLVWKPHLGMMNIELELKDETLDLTVSPVHAVIIMKFQTQPKWSISELSSELEMTPSVLRRKIAFWQGQGLLKETCPDVYQLVEDRRGRPHDLIMVDDEEMESAMASAQQQKEEEMQVFWTYIQGMLANLNCLTLERIHSMLRMFAMEEPSSSEVTVQELKNFLDNKVKDQALLFSSGVYRLNK